MNRLKSILFALIAIAGISIGMPAVAADVDPHIETKTASLALNKGEKWPTDQKLRQYVTEIRQLLVVAKQSTTQDRMTGHDHQLLGAAIEKNVLSIFANCELELNADANLHIIIGELVGSVAALKGESPAKAKAGITRAIAAVNQYGRFFNHPGWRPI